MSSFLSGLGARLVVRPRAVGGRGLRNGLATAVLLLAATVGGPSALATDEADLIDGEGTVQEVTLGTSTVLISGFLYRVEPHADVQVRGNASSLAGIAPGMKVRFLYENFEGFKAEMSAISEGNVIVELEQLPDSYEIQQH